MNFYSHIKFNLKYRATPEVPNSKTVKRYAGQKHSALWLHIFPISMRSDWLKLSESTYAWFKCDKKVPCQKAFYNFGFLEKPNLDYQIRKPVKGSIKLDKIIWTRFIHILDCNFELKCIYLHIGWQKSYQNKFCAPI